MPEEIDLTEEEEEKLDEVWEDIDKEASLDDDVSMSTDVHGREHAPAGSRDGGRFVPKNEKEYANVEVHKTVVLRAIEKLKMARIPTDEEKQAAEEGIEKKGEALYRKELRGNSTNRRDRRNKLLNEFGDGEKCPCVYCGVMVTHGTMEQSKIYTTSEGGRFRTPNVVPSCGDCNKKRKDTPFLEAIKKTVSYVKNRSKTAR